MFIGAFFWALYVALEPYVRRRWPESMIAWSRLLVGGVRNPMVGAHVLIGVAFGVAYTLLFSLRSLRTYGEAASVDLDTVADVPRMLGFFAAALSDSVGFSMGLFFLFFLVRAVLRRPWVSAVVFILFFTSVQIAFSPDPVLEGTIALVQFGLAIFILTRFGVLPMIVCTFVSYLLPSFPLTTDFSTWYAGSTLFALWTVLALTAYGFATAGAGRQLFKPGLLDAA